MSGDRALNRGIKLYPEKCGDLSGGQSYRNISTQAREVGENYFPPAPGFR